MREVIDIEQLLFWAYRTQAVDRMVMSMERAFEPSGFGSTWHGLMQLAALGVRVQTPAPGLASLGATAPDDALVVHDAVLRLGDMFIEWAGAEEVHIWDDALATEAGCRIAEIGGQWVIAPVRARDGAMVHDMARPVTRAVTAPLVIVHAKAATRPECHLDWRPARGRPARDRLATDFRGRPRKQGAGVLTVEEVRYYRALYCVWHATLSALAVELDEILDGYRVQPPAAPASPWDCAIPAA